MYIINIKDYLLICLCPLLLLKMCHFHLLIVLISDDSEEELLLKSELISTSLDIDTCDDFLVAGNKRHYLYQINLKKGGKVAICPYAILLDSKSDRLILSKSHDQEEILLNKENYTFDIVKTTTKELENNEKLVIRVLDSEILEKTNTKKV